jgi:hypothetical protein
MQQNWGKIALWATLLFMVLMIYVVWKVYRAESQLEEFFATELAPGDTTAGVRIQNINISAWSGEVTINKIVFYENALETAWNAEFIAINIGRWRSMQMGVLSSAYVLAKMDEASVTVGGLSFKDNLSPIDVNFELFGSPLQLFPLLGEQRLPRGSFRARFEVPQIDGNWTSLLLANEILPTSVLFFTEHSNNALSGEIAVDPSTGRLSLKDVSLKNDLAEVRLNTTLFYYVKQSLLNPIRYTFGLEIMGKRSEESGKIRLNDNFSIEAEHIEWQLEGVFPNDTLIVSAEFFENATTTSLNITNLSLYPAPGSMGQLEQMLILFGVPTNQFDFSEMSFNADFMPNGDYNVSDLTLTHANFTATYVGIIRAGRVPNINDAPITGSIRLSNLSEPLQIATENIELIMGMRFQRDQEAIILPVRGTLGAPQLF